MPLPEDGASFQSRFHARWPALRDPDVRALAWLLDAPSLLDPGSSAWRGRIASLPPGAAERAMPWLAELDRDPAALRRFLDVQPFTRLGRHAEKLMAFWLQHEGLLVASGVQVRASANETVGEFDFLVRLPEGLVHWEFATKLYLLEETGRGAAADYFVGPNLADTLGRKMRKIFDRQLALAEHPAAAAVLPAPVVAARALVKGWLFYHRREPACGLPPGVAADHCIGFWCTLAECDLLAAPRYAILPRLRWLAPARLPMEETIDRKEMADTLRARFVDDSMPVLVALLEERDGEAFEVERGFIVPDDWQQRAHARPSRPVPTEAGTAE